MLSISYICLSGPYIGRKRTEKHPYLYALLNEVFGKGPAQPRYTFVSEFQLLVSYIRLEWEVKQKLIR